MSFTKRILFGSILVLSFSANAQENFTGFWQPQAALNYRVSSGYHHNFSLSNRSFLYREENQEFTVRQLDLVHFSKIVVKDNQSIAFGIQYRLRETFDGGSDELRLTQQYNLTKRPSVVRWGHRFRSEQRITRNPIVHRFRYRFAIDFPLSGQKLDVGEAYLVGSVEKLLSLSKGQSSQYDARFNGQIGWQLGEEVKFQFGVEYRFEDYTAQQVNHVAFLLTSIQLTL